MNTPRYGLIGYPLTHSFSPAYFAAKFEREHIAAVYEKFGLQSIADLPSLLQSRADICGLNVTIPYKQSVIPYLDKLSEAAAKIGAVNCIDIRDGVLTGHNTDVIGFERSLLPLLQPVHRNALVLGTGGSSLAVKYVLEKLGIAFTCVSRTGGPGVLTYEALGEALLHAHPLIVNTTPLGMYPETEACPALPYAFLTPAHLLYDLVYNPGETKFLRLGRERGAAVKNGLEMLHLQAEASWEIWNR